jgi:hypothetical protein
MNEKEKWERIREKITKSCKIDDNLKYKIPTKINAFTKPIIEYTIYQTSTILVKKIYK